MRVRKSAFTAIAASELAAVGLTRMYQLAVSPSHTYSKLQQNTSHPSDQAPMVLGKRLSAEHTAF